MQLSKDMIKDASIIAAIIVAVATMIVGVLSYLLTRETKKINRQQEAIAMYKTEIRTRILEETVACEWLRELGIADTANAAKLKLRTKLEEKHHCRPNLSASDVKL